MTSSAQTRAAVCEARERQRHRLLDSGVDRNARLDPSLLRTHVRVSDEAQALLATAYRNGSLSTRGRHRVLRVAQTVADLDCRDRVERRDLLCALSLRRRSGQGDERPVAQPRG